LGSTSLSSCSVANYTRRFEGLASRSIVWNRVMETVPVTGIPPWDREMGQGEMRIFRFDLGQPVRVWKHKPRKSQNAVGQIGKPWGSFSPRILAIVPAVPARPVYRGTGTCRATRAVRVSLAVSGRSDGGICLYRRWLTAPLLASVRGRKRRGVRGRAPRESADLKKAHKRGTTYPVECEPVHSSCKGKTRVENDGDYDPRQSVMLSSSIPQFLQHTGSGSHSK